MCGYTKSLQSHLPLCDPMAIAHQAPLPMGFSSQEYWSGVLFPTLEGVPDSEIEPALNLLHLLHWCVGSLLLGPPGKPKLACKCVQISFLEL